MRRRTNSATVSAEDLRRPIPGRLRELRLAAGLTQQRLADVAGVSETTVYQLERDAGDAVPDVQERLAGALNVSVDQLFAPAERFLTERAAAKRAGVSVPTIHNAIKTGALHTIATVDEPPRVEELPEMMSIRQVADLAGVSRKAVNNQMSKLGGERQADGSWLVPRDMAVRYAAEHKLAHHRIDPDEFDRYTEARKQARAKDGPPGPKVCALPGCDQPVRWRGTKRRYCSVAHYREARRENPKAPLRAAAGRCGSPTCNDPGCEVRPDYCHRDRCNRKAAIANHTSTPIRWVKDAPTLYCSQRCAVLDRNLGEADRAALRELKADGYVIPARSIAKLRGRSTEHVRRRADKWGIGRRGPEGVWWFRRQDEEEFTKRLEAYDHLTYRQPDEGEWGRLNRNLARAPGKPPGRRPQYTADEAENVRRLDLDPNMTLGKITIKTGLSRGQVRRIRSDSRATLGQISA